jgi:hypothetical protein
MTNDLTKQAETKTMPALAPEQQSLTVFGTSPQEMAHGQAHLIEWCDLKLANERELLADSEQNYETARKAKWRSYPWAQRAELHKQTITYYEKIKVALEAGYWLVPPMPFDIFAYRTDREKPRTEQPFNALPVGEGENVGLPSIWRSNRGTYRHWQDIEFPVTLVKPQVLAATEKAMARKIFDEIGILPATVTTPTNTMRLPVNRDPIVVARIRNPRKPKTHAGALFFVAWWLDYNAL